MFAVALPIRTDRTVWFDDVGKLVSPESEKRPEFCNLVFDIINENLSEVEMSRYRRLLVKSNERIGYSLNTVKIFQKVATPDDAWSDLMFQWNSMISAFKANRNRQDSIDYVPFIDFAYPKLLNLYRHSRDCINDVLEVRAIREGGPKEEVPLSRLKVDLDTLEISFDGVVYQIKSSKAALWLKLLADNEKTWFTSSDAVLLEPDLEKSRPDKLKSYLPEEIRSMIESNPSKGSRIVLPAP